MKAIKAVDIIRKISHDRGIDTLAQSDIDLVPLNGLNVHKREIWNMRITSDPDTDLLQMSEKYKNKAGYSYKFPVRNLEEGKALCLELSRDFGTPPCEMSTLQKFKEGEQLYLVVHIHPEFTFTSKANKPVRATREVVLNFV